MKTIASVESFTGGLFAYTIIKRPGASKFFKGSLIAYNNQIKEKFGIDISKGVVNEVVAKQMALRGKEYFGVDICVAFTGNAGPEVLEKKPQGLVYIAINNVVYELTLTGKRHEIMKKAVNFALEKINF